MDNVRFHKMNDIKTMIFENGHIVEFLPPYSPFLNPIENVFSKWKNIVERDRNSSEDKLIESIGSGFH
ncbi:MAG: hypothetical protein GY938_27610 [Ketobacter sp.]|nr:hypothetical protein [Ketobacter sp.]